MGLIVDDVMPRIDGPENMSILKRYQLDFDRSPDFDRWKR